MEDRYCRVGRVNVRYWELGEGPPVVLIHGIGASVEYWQPNIEPLARQHRVFAVDLPGFGWSDKIEEELTEALLRQFIIRFLDAQGVDRASLVGNSMGGLFALSAAIDYAERVHKLVLVDNAGFGASVAWWLRLLSIPGLGELIFRPGSRTLRWIAPFLFFNPSPLIDSWVGYAAELLALPGARRAFLQVLRQGVNLRGLRPEFRSRIRDSLKHLHVPTLIVWGHQDRVIPMSQGLAGLAQIPGCELHIFDRCGHLPQLERPAEFNRLVLAFLRDAEDRYTGTQVDRYTGSR